MVFALLFGVFTTSLSALPAVKWAAVDAAILMASPVWGLRPARAARSVVLKLPKAGSATVFAIGRAFGNHRAYRVNDRLGVLLGRAALRCDDISEFALLHCLGSSRIEWMRRANTWADAAADRGCRSAGQYVSEAYHKGAGCSLQGSSMQIAPAFDADSRLLSASAPRRTGATR